jgi:hypothetical protein
MRLLALAALIALAASGVAQEQPKAKTLKDQCVDIYLAGIYPGACIRDLARVYQAESKNVLQSRCGRGCESVPNV